MFNHELETQIDLFLQTMDNSNSFQIFIVFKKDKNGSLMYAINFNWESED